MLENLEHASTDPVKCVEYISTVAGLAADLINKKEEDWKMIFYSTNSDKMIEIVRILYSISSP